ncbi:G-type lectin S-receptor-like serine/threonine-protein kinase RLK1 [Lycium barbarum]|uniref:G-type lectin S-receptor-like serine/threonine-protein kinase RLK1 n=1 Tax=Lycium barbarum TaxID=112863 RepID=UPI00293EFC85|nr:G-type lectin S-receptor-like serine/threonine-protein kinase RLK1 [Lycium barbarum]
MASAVVPYLFLLATFLLLLPSTIAQSYKNVSWGSTLTTSDVTIFWPSPFEEFAFGFQKIGNGSSGFLLAIWFNKLKEKTIVWSANRDKIVPDGSKIELCMDGRLVLTDPNGQEIWARGMASAGPAYGAMLYSGNFSFDEPTDTILPGQVLKGRTRPVSSFSDTNVSSGKFELSVKDDGNLGLHPVATRDEYLLIETAGSGYQVVFNQSGFIFFQAKNGTMLNLLSSSIEANSTTSQLGGVACGFNSVCLIGTDRRPRCDCPVGYILNDPNDKIGNCRQNFPDQVFNNESQDVEAFTIHELVNTNWFGSDYESYQDVTKDWCKQNCLSDCFFVAAVYGTDNICWKKRYPLLNGRAYPANLGKALLKIGRDNSTAGSTTMTTPQSQTGEKRKNQSSLIISGSEKIQKLVPYQAVTGLNIRSFSYNELEEATNGFEDEFGTGAFSTVYKAVLND